jgi:hypothetical protein
MEPTDKQKKLIKVVKMQAEFWESTNDITSPTHLCDIDETINLELDLSEEDTNKFSELLQGLYFFIRNKS